MTQAVRYYGKAFQTMSLPDLMDTQRRFYSDFLQMDTPSQERKNDGLEAVFREAFPIDSYDGSVSLEYLEYQIGEPRHSPDECRALRLTYAGPLKIRVRLTGKVTVEEWVYLGEIPLMIGGGEFVVNGAERVIVTQLQRSPGCDFSSEVHSSGKRLHSCRIIPERGSWIQVEVNSKDQLTIRIDRSGKVAATTFLRALAVEMDSTTNLPVAYDASRGNVGVVETRRLEQWAPLLDSDDDILRAFHPVIEYALTDDILDVLAKMDKENKPLPLCVSRVIDYTNCQVLIPGCTRLTRALLEKRVEGVAGDGERPTVLSRLRDAGVTVLEVIGSRGENDEFVGLEDDLIANTLMEDRERIEDWANGIIRDIIRLSDTPKRLKALFAKSEGASPEAVAKAVREALSSAREGRDGKPRAAGAFFLEAVETDRETLDLIEQNVAAGLAADLAKGEDILSDGDIRKMDEVLTGRLVWRIAWSGGLDRAQYIWSLLEIYKRLRPGTPASRDKAQELFFERFFDEKRYSFGEIGRFRLNRKFAVDDDRRMTMAGIDFLHICHYLLKLRADDGVIDDIDHLENRRIRTIKDLVMSELRSALIKLRRGAREQMVIKAAGNELAQIGDLFGYTITDAGSTEFVRDQVIDEVTYRAAVKKWGAGAFDVKKHPLHLKVAIKPDPQLRIEVGKIVTEAEAAAFAAEKSRAEFADIPLKSWLIIDAQETELVVGDIISDEDYQAAQRKYGMSSFLALSLVLKKGEGVDGGLYRAYQEKYGDIPGMAMQNLIRPHQLLNSATVSATLEYFFARGELSQVVDQSNPLSQLVHERRLSALGPGGLNRKRAGFEVRDVHTSHYGRICPVETPEGTNIGLIVSLANYSAVNDLGFLITPYYVVKNRAISKDVVWLRADEEGNHYIAQADIAVDTGGKILAERPICRHNEDFMHCNADQVTLVDVSPKQLVGISASLIPFLEHDDANRALMGSNMQRQAVPLVRPDIPLVGTGMERDVVRHSGMVVRAREDGEVLYADALRIVVSSKELTSGKRVYKLHKYKGLNDGTTLNQTPLVRRGDRVRRGDPLSEGAATKGGELALGKNTAVAFLSFEGCNFEDAILCSEKLIRDDAFTSVHIEEFTCEIRETKVGAEEITRDIPGVSEAALANLDEGGLIRIGTRVEPGDILVGKIAPKAKSEFSSEEKLLRAIFGRVGEDVKNDSLTIPPGTEGYVINVKRFSRRGVGVLAADVDLEAGLGRAMEALGEMGGEVDTTTAAAALGEESSQVRKVKSDGDHDHKVRDAIKRLETVTRERIVQEITLKFKRLTEVIGEVPVNKRTGKVLKTPRQIDFERMMELHEQSNFGDLSYPAGKRERVKAICLEHDHRIRFLETRCEVEVGRLRRGDELRPGVLELVKVYVAVKRKLSLGDKMAGRHGNKGVVARILPEEDMPFLEDGTPVEMVLNPLGVPSRMNVGQILETHLGWAGSKLGFRAVTPVFDGATEQNIRAALVEAGLPEDGKAILYDGRTGEPFHEPVTVGNMYMIKLHHLVAEKIHARATGPYSLITQQPLGGKARNGGQRFGEMEVWALEAYGAANILQELLTYKSDDVDGRTKIYEAMVKGESTVEPGMPVSFDVLCNEIRGIGLNIKLERSGRPGEGGDEV
ncbi:MAG: DNA-directed RNA polymerase subunit beta [Planctomycetota bacterium]|jgi:DNA-directed RNA polymerase beta subunit|nr:DNA-directed RNA polymerase subunit beta [Planctomycetota bacterium]